VEADAARARERRRRDRARFLDRQNDRARRGRLSARVGAIAMADLRAQERGERTRIAAAAERRVHARPERLDRAARARDSAAGRS